MRSYRAICSSCMEENGDGAARACPACGSRRLVVVAGRPQSGRTPKKAVKARTLRRRRGGTPAAKVERITPVRPAKVKQVKVRTERPTLARTSDPSKHPLRSFKPARPPAPKTERLARPGGASLARIIRDRLERLVGVHKGVILNPDGSITAPFSAALEALG